MHSWWQAVDEAKEKEKAEAAAKKKKEDWCVDVASLTVLCVLF